MLASHEADVSCNVHNQSRQISAYQICISEMSKQIMLRYYDK